MVDGAAEQPPPRPCKRCKATPAPYILRNDPTCRYVLHFPLGSKLKSGGGGSFSFPFALFCFALFRAGPAGGFLAWDAWPLRAETLAVPCCGGLRNQEPVCETGSRTKGTKKEEEEE